MCGETHIGISVRFKNILKAHCHWAKTLAGHINNDGYEKGDERKLYKVPSYLLQITVAGSQPCKISSSHEHK